MAGKMGGARPGAGRPKGSLSKESQVVKTAVLNAFRKVGAEDYLARVAQEDPKTFCSLLGRILPAEINASLSGKDGGPLEIKWLSK